jgi:cytochrome P450
VSVAAPVVDRMRSWYVFDDYGNPYDFFAELRAAAPVAYSERFGGFYLVTGYGEQRTVLRDPATFSSTIPGNFIPSFEDPMGPMIPLSVDPPDLVAYRASLAPFFAPTLVKTMEDAIRARARTLLEAYVAQGGGDLVSAFCVPYPCETILIHLGLPVSDMPQLLAWKDSLIRDGLSGDPERTKFVEEVTRPSLLAYYHAALDRREAMTDRPNDMLTGLVEATFRGRPFTRDEMVRSMHLFFQAGLDTVTNVLGLSFLWLAEHPDRWRELVAGPALIREAVEELLRFNTPVTVCRVLTRDVALGGVALKAGDRLMLCLASGSRDESEFAGGAEMDWQRSPNRHFGFGAGAHRCLGSHLARTELIVAFEEAVRIIPAIAADPDDPVQRFYGAIFGVERLPLRLNGSLRPLTTCRIFSFFPATAPLRCRRDREGATDDSVPDRRPRARRALRADRDGPDDHLPVHRRAEFRVRGDGLR